MEIVLFITLLILCATILIESILLYVQLKGRKITKMFGRSGFKVHVAVTCSLWALFLAALFLLQFQENQHFHSNVLLSYFGLVVSLNGLCLAGWGFSALGLKRSLCINFYRPNIEVVDRSIYKHLYHPEDIGFFLMLLGLALFTSSFANLFLALLFVLLIIPHAVIENRPLKRKIKVEEDFTPIPKP